MEREEWVYCDCCGTVKMGKKRGDMLVQRKRDHGRSHVKIYSLVDNGRKLEVKSSLTTE